MTPRRRHRHSHQEHKRVRRGIWKLVHQEKIQHRIQLRIFKYTVSPRLRRGLKVFLSGSLV
jgi:hypothetical protein